MIEVTKGKNPTSSIRRGFSYQLYCGIRLFIDWLREPSLYKWVLFEGAGTVEGAFYLDDIMLCDIVASKTSGKSVRTDRNGKYRLYTSSGTQIIEYKKKDYKGFKKTISKKYGRQKIDVVLLNMTMMIGEEVVITANAPVYKKPSVSKETFSREEIMQVAGPKQDIFEAIKILPGIAVVNDFSAEFAIRGGDPGETGVFLDDSRVTTPFHMEMTQEGTSGGLVTIFNNDMIENVTLYTGGFPAKYGNAMSGILAIDSRKANEGKKEFKLGVSLIDARFYYNNPINENLGFTIAGRRNYLDVLLGLLVAAAGDTDAGFGSETEVESFAFVFPWFWDLHMKVDYDSKKGDRLSAYILPTANYAKLEFEGVIEYPEDESGNMPPYMTGISTYSMVFLWETKGTVAYTEWEHDFSDKLSSLLSLTYNNKTYNVIQKISSTRPEMELDTLQQIVIKDLDIRPELKYAPNKSHDIRLGASFKPTLVEANLRAVDSVSVSTDPVTGNYIIDFSHLTSSYTLLSNFYSVYLQDRWEMAERLYVDLGIRYDYLEYNNDHMIAPRLGISYGLTKKITARAAWGHFYQHPSIDDFIPEFGGNTELSAFRAEHKIVSIETELPHNTSLKIEGYLKDYTNLISEDLSAPLPNGTDIYNKLNGGIGYSRGIELLIRNNYSSKFSGWISYTLSEAMKKEGTDDKLYPFDYDRRHIFTTSINFKPKRRINVGIVWKLFSGTPYTPQVRDGQVGTLWEAEEGEKNSERTPGYNRIDLRISKEHVYRKMTLITYIEVVNLFNAKNVSSYQWNQMEGEMQPSYMLPIIPFVGIEAKF